MRNVQCCLKPLAAGLIFGGILAIAGCSGGSSAPVAAAPAPTTFTVAGTAATGAVFDNATVTIIASDGTSYPVGATVLTGTDGSYTITLPLTAKPPFVVQAVRDDKTLVSVVAEAKSTTTNITPVTNLIASRLSTSGDPAKLAGEINDNYKANKPVLFDAAALKIKVAEVVALIKPLMDAVGDSTDPLNGKFVADGTGADKVLDSLSISITPSSATTVNIEVAVKQKLPDGVDPAVIAFTNATAPAAALPTVTATDLVASGTTPLIADFLQRMTACYALAQTVRVTSAGTAAADIIAPACKDLFVGNNPASYLNNGGIVSSKQAFSYLFDSGTGVKFDRGTYEFTRGNGDLVIAYRATDSAASSTNNTLAVRTDTDGKLRAIGNQYKYNGSVTAWHQLRTFINQPAATYYSIGYLPNVNNSVDASGNPIFAKVVVTTPKGGTLTLQPTAGSSYLPLVKGTTVTGTNFLRVRSVYADPANSAKNPADADTTLFFASTPLADADIAALPAQANWKFDYYLASNPTVLDTTQHYKTRARAMTIAELQTQPLAKVTDADIATAQANTKTNATTGGKYVPTPPTGPVTLDWVVPTGALAPTSIEVWGGATVSGIKISFNDQAPVASTARTGDISCSAASSKDTHCNAGNYVAGGLSDAHLWASDPLGREFSSHYAFYTITIP